MSYAVPIPSHSARLTEQLLSYWENLRGSRPFPNEEEVNPDALTEIWNSCFLVQVRDAEVFSYSYLGDALIEAYGDDWTGKEISEALVYPHPLPLFHAFRTAARTAKAVSDENEFTNANGLTVKYRSCVVPLGANHGDQVRYLLGGMKWKIY